MSRSQAQQLEQALNRLAEAERQMGSAASAMQNGRQQQQQQSGRNSKLGAKDNKVNRVSKDNNRGNTGSRVNKVDRSRAAVLKPKRRPMPAALPNSYRQPATCCRGCASRKMGTP